MASRPNSSLTTSSAAKDKPSHSKPETKLKHGKVIHKFTSESYMRLTCDDGATNAHNTKFIDKSSSNSSTSIGSGSGGGGSAGANSSLVSNNVANKRKGASFQITSVSVSSTQFGQHHLQRNSTDNNGDDSADDLDDSHTDDNISRITDYETPSISETFSGEDVFFAQQNAFGTAPVIPTSSQYGLAIVGPDMGGNGSNLTDVHVSVTDAGINIMGPISSKQDPDHKNERFKVVKIESTEPFKRGRWMCMDYLDHTTLQAQDDGIDGTSSDEHMTSTKDETHNDERKLLTMNNGEFEHVISDNEDLDHEVNKITNHHHNIHSEASHHHHPVTMTSIPNDFSKQPSNIHHHVAQSMPQAQIETILTQEKLLHHTEHPQTISEQQQHTQQIPPSHTQQQHMQQHAQTMTPEMIHASVMHQEQQQNFHHQQGVTLPTNIILQNIEQSQQQLNSPNNSSNVVLPPTTITLNEHKDVDLQQQQNDATTMTNQFQNTQVGDSSRNEIDQQQLLVGNVMNSGDGQNASSPSSSAGPGTVAEGVNSNNINNSGSSAVVSEINESASNSGNANSATVGAESDGQTLNEDNER